MNKNLEKFLNGAMLAVLLFVAGTVLMFLGLILPVLLMIAFGPIVGLISLVVAVAIVGGLASLIADRL